MRTKILSPRKFQGVWEFTVRSWSQGSSIRTKDAPSISIIWEIRVLGALCQELGQRLKYFLVSHSLTFHLRIIISSNAGDVGSIPGSERSPGGGNGNPLQYACLGNPMNRGAWQAAVPGVAKSQTRLSTHVHKHTHVCNTAKQVIGILLFSEQSSASYTGTVNKMCFLPMRGLLPLLGNRHINQLSQFSSKNTFIDASCFFFFK